MTESKMTKILIDLAARKDYGVFYLIDILQQDESKRVREIIKVSDLAEEFKKKEGRFYKQYRLGSDFKELIKHIEKGEEMQIKCFYKDTYEAFTLEKSMIKKWEEEQEYVQKRKEQRKKDYLKFMGTFGLYGSSLIDNKIFML